MNMSEPVTTVTLGTIATHGGVALFGAFAHAINAHRNGTSKGIMDFLALTVLSSFSGIIFAFFAFHLFDNAYITLAITGSGGYVGVEGLALVSKKAVQFVASSVGEPDKK